MIRIASLLVRAAALLALALPALAQEAAVTRRPTELRETPAAAGRTLAALPAQVAVTRLAERHGPWVRARTADGTLGWLHIFDLAPASGSAVAAAGGGVGDALRGVTQFLGRPGAPTATSASGIRGLGAEDIAQAQPDAAAVTRLEALRQGDADARAFAERAPWRTVAVDPLPAPERSAPAQARNPQAQ